MAATSSCDRYHRQARSQGRLFPELFYGICVQIRPVPFLEIGAFEAGMSERMAASLPDAAVYAFEANPFVWEYYEGLVAPSIHYLRSAVGSEVGEKKLLIPRTMPKRYEPYELPRENPLGSLLPRTDEGVRYEEVSVPCTTVDTFVGQLTPRTPTAVWMDVEGVTGDVLQGARRAWPMTSRCSASNSRTAGVGIGNGSIMRSMDS
jgi:FkbM family methyltransferase